MTAAEAQQRVRRCVEAALPQWYGPQARLAALTGPRSHAWSFQFDLEADTPQGPRRLVVKIPRWEEAPTLAAALVAGPQEATRREYAALGAVAAAVAAAGDSGLAAVAPVAYLAEINAIVTVRLPAVPLRSRLGPWPGAEGRLAPLLRRAGRALRLYHEKAAGAVPGSIDGAALAAELEAGAARLAAAGLPPSAAAALAAQARQRDGEPALVGAAHGDLSPANVLVTPDGRVAVLDPNLVPGPLLEDVAKLLTALRMRRARVLTLGRLGGRGLRTAEAAFLDGYGPADPGLLVFLRAVATARRGAEMAERLAGLPFWLRRPAAAVLGRYLAAELSRFGA